MFYATSKKDSSFNAGPYQTYAEATSKAPIDLGLKKGDHFWIGEGITPEPQLEVDADDVIDQIVCRLHDQYGDSVENYLSNVPKNELELLTSKLQTAIAEWIKETGNSPEFVAIPEENIKEAVFVGLPGETLYGQSKADKERFRKLRYAGARP